MRCCFLTGDAGGSSDEALLGLGALVLAKPFTLGQLADTLRRALSEPT